MAGSKESTKARLVAGAVCACLAAPLSAAQPPTLPAGPLTYEAALDVATSRNLAVEAARRQRAIREAAVAAARQVPNPDLSMEVTRDTPHAAAVFSLPVEIGGRRARRVDLAREELSLADIDVQAELRAVRRELRQTFYSLVAADERVRLAATVLDIARRVRDAAQARFETGAAPRLEVLQADLGVTRAETDLDIARGTRISAQASLNAVLNVPPGQEVAVSGSLSDRTAAPLYDRALALATSSNVDLVALDREIAIEQRRLALLRAERAPTPVFSVSTLFNSPGDYTAGVGGGVSLTLPIFTRNQGEIAGSIATTAQLRTRREATARAVENDVFGTLARVEAQRRQADAYAHKLVPTAADLETLAEEAYRAGRTSMLAVFEAQRSLRDLRREALQAALDLQFSLADLEGILGTAIP